MIKKLRYTEIIDRYQSNEMSADELKRFNIELLTNKALAKEFRLELDLDVILRQDKIIDFRKKLLNIYHLGESKKKTVNIVSIGARKWYMAAASVAFLMVLGGLLLFTMPKNYSNDDLFRKYYSTENVLDVARSGNANIVEAVIKFQEKDYKSATQLFSIILQSETDNTAAWFYNGIACIETQQFDNAIKSFQRIIADNNSFYIEHAEWYLGLCYLKNNATNKAIVQFQKIASESRNYHKADAQQILAKLQKK
jgi:tetratricopeptide (TPR) repeat protein